MHDGGDVWCGRADLGECDSEVGSGLWELQRGRDVPRVGQQLWMQGDDGVQYDVAVRVDCGDGDVGPNVQWDPSMCGWRAD